MKRPTDLAALEVLGASSASASSAQDFAQVCEHLKAEHLSLLARAMRYEDHPVMAWEHDRLQRAANFIVDLMPLLARMEVLGLHRSIAFARSLQGIEQAIADVEAADGREQSEFLDDASDAARHWATVAIRRHLERRASGYVPKEARGGQPVSDLAALRHAILINPIVTLRYPGRFADWATQAPTAFLQVEGEEDTVPSPLERSSTSH